jgi:hypothetical protein
VETPETAKGEPEVLGLGHDEMAEVVEGLVKRNLGGCNRDRTQCRTTCSRYNLRRVTRGFYMLPKSLYELVPFLYIVLGVVAALVLYNSYAIISGILLLTVALMILYMRLKSRTKAMEHFERLYTQKKRREEE